MQFSLPLIYPITDKKLAHRTSHLSILKELVSGGAEFVQIRDASTPIRELMRDIIECAEFASKKGVTLIINNRCDLVLGSGAMGVHLGQEDLPPEAARSILGSNKIIGFSAHSIDQVRKSSTLPIQYVGFGPIYPTLTKEDAAPAVGLRLLSAACRTSSVPVVAIGGIGLDQVGEVLKAGAASAAVISALMGAKDIARRMNRFLETAREIKSTLSRTGTFRE
jgi:thiamine-phosphate pyrophosphorylase